MVREGPGPTGARKELLRVSVVLWRSPGNYLLKRNRKFVGVKRPPFADFFPGVVILYQGSIVTALLQSSNPREEFKRGLFRPCQISVGDR